jgi:hypothetical protein
MINLRVIIPNNSEQDEKTLVRLSDRAAALGVV